MHAVVPQALWQLYCPRRTSCAMKVDVHLPSGVGCSISLSPKRPISELKATAQQHFQRHLKLTANGRQLDLKTTLSEAGLRDGDVVAAVVQLGKLASTGTAFAFHGNGDEVVTIQNTAETAARCKSS